MAPLADRDHGKHDLPHDDADGDGEHQDDPSAPLGTSGGGVEHDELELTRHDRVWVET